MRGHNICFGGEIRKIIFENPQYSLLSEALPYTLTARPTPPDWPCMELYTCKTKAPPKFWQLHRLVWSKRVYCHLIPHLFKEWRILRLPICCLNKVVLLKRVESWREEFASPQESIFLLWIEHTDISGKMAELLPLRGKMEELLPLKVCSFIFFCPVHYGPF